MELRSKIRNKRTERNNVLHRKFAAERQLSRFLTLLCQINNRLDYNNNVSFMYKVDALERHISQISQNLSNLRKEEEDMRDKVVILEMESSVLVRDHITKSN